MNYSAKLQKKIDQLAIQKENVLYLPIAMEHLNRIRNKSKTVEFRTLSDFYLRKINKYDKQHQFVAAKPLKYVLFQGGYNADSPRLLVELKDPVEKYNAYENLPAEIINSKLQDGKRVMTIEEGKKKYPNIFKEAMVEGFMEDDEFLALQLGDIVFEEGF